MVQNNSKKIILITGATSGIGEATAKILSENYNLILCGRRENRLLEIQQTLSNKTEILTLNFDISNRNDVHDSINSIPDEWKHIDVLINNAGNAHGLDFIDEGEVDDWDKMIDINVKGLLYISKEILKIMVSNNSGHIINIGSIAGKEVYQKGNVYCASKFAVNALSEGMRVDLVDKNIKVSQVNPGLVNTEFSKVRFKNDLDKAKSVYSGIDPLYAEDIAEVIKYIIERPKNINISDLTILPRSQASSVVIDRKN